MHLRQGLYARLEGTRFARLPAFAGVVGPHQDSRKSMIGTVDPLREPTQGRSGSRTARRDFACGRRSTSGSS